MGEWRYSKSEIAGGKNFEGFVGYEGLNQYFCSGVGQRGVLLLR